MLADRVGGGEWQGDDGLLLLKRLSQMARGRDCRCAGAAQRELVDRGVRELRFARARLFGSAPEALAGGARALVALAVNGSPRDVALSVLGVPPASHSHPVGRRDRRPALRSRDWSTNPRGVASVPASPRCGRQARYALAAAAMTVVDAIVGRSRRMVELLRGARPGARPRHAHAYRRACRSDSVPPASSR